MCDVFGCHDIVSDNDLRRVARKVNERMVGETGTFSGTIADSQDADLLLKHRFDWKCRGGETADAVDSKSTVGNHMRVQVPPSASTKSKGFFRDHLGVVIQKTRLF
jgi:hypothetical protein